MKQNLYTISVVGLGKLGVPMVACFASKGHQVIGVDVNSNNVTFAYMARAVGVEPTLAEATDQISQVSRLSKLVTSYLPDGGTVGILGLSYKADTSVVEESQGVGLAQDLLNKNVTVRGL